MDRHTKVMIEAAVAGSQILLKYFGQTLESAQKSMASDIRTKADLESETAILAILRREFPDYNIYSEEAGRIDKGSDYTFIIDPLDGTNNFVLGIPNFSVSIGLLKNEETVAGVVHLPLTDKTYWAEKGQGAWLDGQRLKVSAEDEITKSGVSIVRGYAFQKGFLSRVMVRLEDQRTKRVMVNWSVAYDFCLLAAGKIEAVINNDTEIYDYIAGKLIAAEAGALITDFQGQPGQDKDSVFVASNASTLHQKLLELVS